jgi:hypothetical protein
MINRIFASASILASLCSLALAQTGSSKTPTLLNAEINQLFPDNTSNLITPFDVRQVTLDLVASSANVLGVVINPPPNTLDKGIVITQTPAGSASAQTNYNEIDLTDTASITGSNFGVGLNITHFVGGRPRGIPGNRGPDRGDQ